MQQYRKQGLISPRHSKGSYIYSGEGGVRAILVGLERRQASVAPIREGEVISALAGLYWETKLHYTEVDGVPGSQFKRGVMVI
jgi:hypothetical protein